MSGLKFYTSTLSSKLLLTSFTLLLFGANLNVVAGETPREARKHMLRGQAAMEVAKNASDFQDAIKEFKQAIEKAPNWPGPWFNLGVAQKSAKEYRNAIKSFNKYLKLKPKASDRSAIEDEIIKLEYLAEKSMDVRHKQIEKEGNKLALSGTWNSQMPTYSRRFERPTFLSSWDNLHNKSKVEVTVRGDHFETILNEFSLYRATISGFKLNGERIALTNITRDACGITEQATSLEGEISPDGKMILLIVRGYQLLEGAGCRFDTSSYSRSMLLTR